MKRRSPIALACLFALAAAALLLHQRSKRDAPAPAAASGHAQTKRPSPRPAPARPSCVPGLLAELGDPSLHQASQIKAVRGLPDDLTENEFAQLVEAIRGPVPERQNAGAWHVLVNEMMNVLREPRFRLDGYASAMASLVGDRQADPVVRDYAAQHLALAMDRVARNPGPDDFRLAMETFLRVLENEDESFHDVTGTILMSLTALSETLRPDDLAPYRGRLGAAILPLVSGTRAASISNRISAIQAAGRLGFPDNLPAIRRLAADATSNRWVRLSAVAALGYFGNPEDRDRLAALAANEPAMEPAARTALKTIDERAARPAP